ncbi:MAG: hypothetical protein KC457_08515, partial [Myxococcales bacterium]|nr:hypothetical protein [Myxococcales bacterium]
GIAHCPPRLSPDGKLLLTANREHVHLREVSSDNQTVLSFPGSKRGCPVPSPDWKQLAIIGHDRVFVWPLDIEVLATAAREAAGRTFTDEEIERFALDTLELQD